MTVSEAIAEIGELIPSSAKRGITPDKIRAAFKLICDQLTARENVEVDSIDDLEFPLKKGLIIARLDTNIHETPNLQVFYNDGTAVEKGDLYTWPVQQLKNIL